MAAAKDRIPPQSIEAEMAVLGAMLIEREALERACEIVQEEHFYSGAHRLIYSAMRALYDKNSAVDLVTLTEELKRTGKLSDTGGEGYLSDLIEKVSTAAHVSHYADIVRWFMTAYAIGYVVFGHLIDQGQQSRLPPGQDRAGALIPAIFGGPLAEVGALFFGNRVKAVLALLAASQDVGSVKLTGGTTAVGLAALAPQQVEGALDHRGGTLEPAQRRGQGSVGTPKLLAQAGQVAAHICISYRLYDTDCKRKKQQTARKWPKHAILGKSALVTPFYAPLPHCLNRS